MEATSHGTRRRGRGFKKKLETQEGPRDDLKDFSIIPARHSYSLGHIMLFVSLVLCAAASLRCASQSMAIVLGRLMKGALPIPRWNTGRLWLLRLGYYKLDRAKQRAEDWVWIVDHSVQIGVEKCLVILGIRLSQLQDAQMCLKHADVEPIEILPVKKSNG